MNDQRKVVFEQRLDLMSDESLSDTVADMRAEVIDMLVSRHIPERAYAEQWDAKGLHEGVRSTLNLDLPVEQWAAEEGIDEEHLRERITTAADAAMEQRAARFGPELMGLVERHVVLQTLDTLWREHLANLDHLRSVVGLRGYAQRDPLQEYKSEAFELFQAMLTNLREAVTAQMMRIELAQPEPEQQVPAQMVENHPNPESFDGGGEMMLASAPAENRTVNWEDRDPNDPSTWGKVARNELCPCGSGKKYKHCHGSFV